MREHLYNQLPHLFTSPPLKSCICSSVIPVKPATWGRIWTSWLWHQSHSLWKCKCKQTNRALLWVSIMENNSWKFPSHELSTDKLEGGGGGILLRRVVRKGFIGTSPWPLLYIRWLVIRSVCLKGRKAQTTYNRMPLLGVIMIDCLLLIP